MANYLPDFKRGFLNLKFSIFIKIEMKMYSQSWDHRDGDILKHIYKVRIFQWILIIPFPFCFPYIA
jgi:hypothetical protein